MKKIILNIIIFLFFTLTFLITYCLLSYNKYNIPEFKNSILIIANKELEDYQKGTLLVVEKNPKLAIGDKVFYYDTYSPKVKVKIGTVNKIEKINEQENTIVLDDDVSISSEYVFGNTKYTETYQTLGAILSILTSKWGYLIIIIFPMLLAFIYEIYEIVKEIRRK